MPGDVAQVVKVPAKQAQGLSSNPSTTKTSSERLGDVAQEVEHLFGPWVQSPIPDRQRRVLVAHTCNPSYSGAEIRRTAFQRQPSK
jgi:hypothetical protein